MGSTAYAAKRPEIAEYAWHKAAGSGHQDAVLALGVLLEDRGDLTGAKATVQQAIDSGHPDTVPMARLALGNLLRDQGDLAGAKTAYQQAIDSGHPDVGDQ